VRDVGHHPGHSYLACKVNGRCTRGLGYVCEFTRYEGRSRVAVRDAAIWRPSSSGVDGPVVVAVLEAMKMENRVLAHHDGVVTGLAVAVGDTVGRRTVFCEISDRDGG
jgi:biotin-dependent enzyme